MNTSQLSDSQGTPTRIQPCFDVYFVVQFDFLVIVILICSVYFTEYRRGEARGQMRSNYQTKFETGKSSRRSTFYTLFKIIPKERRTSNGILDPDIPLFIS